VWLSPRDIWFSNREMESLGASLTEVRSELGGISQPCLVIQGAQDGVVSSENADYLERELGPHVKAFQKWILQGKQYRHGFWYLQPDFLNMAIQRALAMSKL